MASKAVKRGPFNFVSTRVVYDNPWMTVREDQIIRPDGKPGIFGVVEGKGGASVLAVDAQGYARLASEYKYGIGKDSLEVVSGGCDPGETPLQAAKRELEEELGLAAKEWTPLGYIDPFTSIMDFPNHLFLATDLREGEGKTDPGEVITPHKVKLDRAVQMVLDGEITHAASCVLILKAARHLKV